MSDRWTDNTISPVVNHKQYYWLKMVSGSLTYPDTTQSTETLCNNRG